MSYPLYGNVIIDSSNNTALGGTLTISNSCKTTSLNNRASIAFAVADISYGALNRGLFNNNVDFADVRITAVIDTVSPTVGTALSVSVSPNHVNPPIEALRVRSNGNVGIGTQTPHFTLDVNGDARIGTTSTNTFTLFNNPFLYVPWTKIASRTSGSGDDIAGLVILSVTAPNPTASSDSSCEMRYYYSVIGKTMYLNYYYKAAQGGTGGGGVYRYVLPSGFSFANWLVTSPVSVNYDIGTRLGSGRIIVNTVVVPSSSVAWYTHGGVNCLVVLREQGTYGYQSNGNFSYLASPSVCYSFEAAIPLA